MLVVIVGGVIKWYWKDVGVGGKYVWLLWYY